MKDKNVNTYSIMKILDDKSIEALNRFLELCEAENKDKSKRRERK
jgi:hypothetical protein